MFHKRETGRAGIAHNPLAERAKPPRICRNGRCIGQCPASPAECSPRTPRCRATANLPMPSAPSRWMPSSPPTPDIPAPRWAWRTSPRCCGADYLKHNPADPRWADRDRFVLSNGHASMLLYSLLHLTGYPLTIDDLRKFRQLGSHTAGHPEHERISASRRPRVRSGRALPTPWAWRWPRNSWPPTFNRPGHDVVDHRTWVFSATAA